MKVMHVDPGKNDPFVHASLKVLTSSASHFLIHSAPKTRHICVRAQQLYLRLPLVTVSCGETLTLYLRSTSTSTASHL